jgi:hypothetical protein
MGQRFTYGLFFDGENDSDAPQLMGLTEASTQIISPEISQTSRGKSSTSRGQAPNLAVQNTNLAGRLRGDSGAVAATSRDSDSGLKPNGNAAHSSLMTAFDETARSRTSKTRRVNGSASHLVTR